MQDRNGQFAEQLLDEVFIADESAPQLTQFNFQGSSKQESGKAEDSPTNVSPDRFYFPIDPNDSTDQYNKEEYFKFEMKFDEQMDAASVQNIGNYTISGTATSKVVLKRVELLDDKQTAIMTVQALPISSAINDKDYLEYNLVDSETLTVSFAAGKIMDAAKLNPLVAGSKTFTYKDLVKPKLKEAIM